MHYDTITYDLINGAAWITLNRPDARNALNTQMRAELTDAVIRAGRSARVIVLQGAGDDFCAGQDFGDGSGEGRMDLERSLRDEYQPLIEAIHNVSLPVVAAVNGAAVGAGANLALAADVVIATQSASFQQVFSQIGLMPDAGATWALPRKIGRAKAMGLALFGDRLTAQEASDLGLIWEVAPDHAFADQVKARVASLAQGPSVAYARIKQAMAVSLDNSLSEQLALEAHMQGECAKSRDFQEGLLAFAEHRPPKFEGR